MKPYGQVYSAATPIWFGVGEDGLYVEGAVIPYYDYISKKCSLGFINNPIESDNIFENIENNNVSVTWRKIKKEKLCTGDTDYAQMSINGEMINSTYNGSATIIANIQASPAEIGRCWQFRNQNRTMNGSIQAIRVYNRVLTDEEIKTNYEIDEYRFGITK